MSALGVTLLAALWALWIVFSVWVMLDSTYGDCRLPGVHRRGGTGLLAMAGWLIASAAVVVAVTTWATT